VGKIRRKLEESGVIIGYSTKIDFAKLGVDVFATETVAIVPHCGKESTHCCSALLESPHVIKLNKLPEQNRFMAFYGFRNLGELEHFFKNGPEQNGVSSHVYCFQHSPIKIFSGKSRLKDCSIGLLTKIVDEI